MRDSLFYIDMAAVQGKQMTLQGALRVRIVDAILNKQLPEGTALPSTRRLAENLGISRNTVTLVYEALVDDGYLTARAKSGFYVSADYKPVADGTFPHLNKTATKESAIRWSDYMVMRPSRSHFVDRPSDWWEYPYPFIYGQVDTETFPLAVWRECSRQSLGRKRLDYWISDTYAQDDPMLLEQICTRLLPRRGIMAKEDNILITMGAQNALWLLTQLLIKPHMAVAMEEPGYADMRAMMQLCTDNIRYIPVDDEGVVVEAIDDACRLVYVTPSHQFPITSSLSLARRVALLEQAARNDFLIIEDDYEFETNYANTPKMALKSMDHEGRVLYVGSLSKTLFPGLRLGYIVADTALIDELRALRRLMLRQPPSNNQRTTALFLSLGHHAALVKRLHKIYRLRWDAMAEALSTHLLGLWQRPSFGGTAYWIKGPDNLDSESLARAVRREGVLIEPCTALFGRENPPKNYFRLGFSSISKERIPEGIRLLGELLPHYRTAD